MVNESGSSKQDDVEGSSPPGAGLTDREFKDAVLRNSNNTLHNSSTTDVAISSSKSELASRSSPRSDLAPLLESDHHASSSHGLLSTVSNTSHPEPSAPSHNQPHTTRIYTSVTPVIIHRSGKSFTHNYGIGPKAALGPGSPMFSTLSLQPGGHWRHDRSGSGSLIPPASPSGVKVPRDRLGLQLNTHQSLHVAPTGHSGTSTPRSTANAAMTGGGGGHLSKGHLTASSMGGAMMVWDEEGRMLAMQMALKVSLASNAFVSS